MKKAAVPVKKVTASVKKAAVPVKKSAPVKKAAVPVKKVTAPVKKSAPVKKAAVPVKKVTASVKKSAPVKKVAAPVTKVSVSVNKKASMQKTAAMTEVAARASARKSAPATKPIPVTAAAPAKKRVPAATPAATRKPVPAPAPSTSKPSGPTIRVDVSPWTASELAAVRADIDQEILRLIQQIADAEEGIADLLRDSGDGAGDDQADAGTKTFEREHEMSLANNARELLLQNERALGRLSDGTYGTCERCANSIGKQRLQAFPRVTMCVSCKQLEERR